MALESIRGACVTIRSGDGGGPVRVCLATPTSIFAEAARPPPVPMELPAPSSVTSSPGTALAFPHVCSRRSQQARRSTTHSAPRHPRRSPKPNASSGARAGGTESCRFSPARSCCGWSSSCSPFLHGAAARATRPCASAGGGGACPVSRDRADLGHRRMSPRRHDTCDTMRSPSRPGALTLNGANRDSHIALAAPSRGGRRSHAHPCRVR
jgi:hypothetical protein